MRSRTWLLPLYLGLTGCGAAQDGAKKAQDGASAPTISTSSMTAKGATSTVSGTVVSPPFNGSASLANVKVVLLDPNTTPARVLGSTTLDTGTSVCKSTSCTFSIDNVDLSQLAAGLVIYTVDTRSTGAEWVPVTTYSSEQGAVEAAAATGALTNQYAFAVNGSGLSAIAKVTKTARPEELVTTGTLIGIAVGTTKEANPVSGLPPFVSGATATVPAGVTLSYPNDMFDGTAAATGIAGAFIGVPASTPLTGTYSVKAGAMDKTHVWSPMPVTLVPGSLQVVFFQADIEG